MDIEYIVDQLSESHSINPALALALNSGYKALILREIIRGCRYKARVKMDFHNGHYWYYESAQKLADKYSYISTSKDAARRNISRWLKEMEDAGILASSKKLNKNRYDQTKWYTINLKAVREMLINGSEFDPTPFKGFGDEVNKMGDGNKGHSFGHDDPPIGHDVHSRGNDVHSKGFNVQPIPPQSSLVTPLLKEKREIEEIRPNAKSDKSDVGGGEKNYNLHPVGSDSHEVMAIDPDTAAQICIDYLKQNPLAVEQLRMNTKYMGRLTQPILEFFEHYFSHTPRMHFINFPYSKQTMVALRGWLRIKAQYSKRANSWYKKQDTDAVYKAPSIPFYNGNLS